MRTSNQDQLTMADADEVGAATASQPMAIPEDKVMRIYPQLPKPTSRSRSGAWTLALAALLVLACRDASAPIILPDPSPTEVAGFQFVYVDVSSGSPSILLLDSVGGSARLSPWGGAWDKDPAWSPDGSRIAFTSGENFVTDIYVMNASGGNRVRLTTDGNGNSRPAWSHDGGRIAFVSRRDGNSEIYVMNADGSHQSRLTFRDNSDTDPAWSPDGNRIAFATDGPSAGILVITPDGAETIQLTSNYGASNYGDTAPAWSPDGSKIAFSSQAHGTNLIFVMNADGSGRAVYSPYGLDATDPSWSPDGNRIAFAAAALCDFWENYCGSEILIRGPDGPFYSVPRENNGYLSDPAWRP